MLSPDLAQKAQAEIGVAIPREHKVSCKHSSSRLQDWGLSHTNSLQSSFPVIGAYARYIFTVSVYVFGGSGCD